MVSKSWSEPSDGGPKTKQLITHGKALATVRDPHQGVFQKIEVINASPPSMLPYSQWSLDHPYPNHTHGAFPSTPKTSLGWLYLHLFTITFPSTSKTPFRRLYLPFFTVNP